MIECTRPANWFRITAPHLCAGLAVNDRLRVIEAAPILSWTLGKSVDELARYCLRKGWTMETLGA